MKPARRILSVVGVLLLVMAAGGPATHAQGGYPEPVDLYVNDFAQLLMPEHASAIRSLFSDLKRDTGIEAVVVTIGSIHDYATGDATIESFATNLFNTWGVGDKAKNNGVMILVAVNDRKVRIEVGAGYESTLNAAMQAVIDEHMLPAFRRNDYSQGIYDGARAVVNELTGQWPNAIAPPSSASSDARQLESALLAALGVAAVGGAAIVGVIRYSRYYRRCPQCHHHTLSTVSRKVSGPTYASAGEKLVIKDCRHCHYHNEDFVVLPMLVQSSSSSDSGSGGDFGGGDFGGGSSSGDGASGSW